MIRRDHVNANGLACWVLISQQDHARLAGELALSWGAAPWTELPVKETLLPTIFRHDDGWNGWDAEPDVDGETGRPVDFTEMELATAQSIWRNSIDSVADLGPLAQYLVAGHFVALRQRSDESDEYRNSSFIDEFSQRCDQWLTAWTAQFSQATTADALTALEMLQVFDLISLWFCCAERSESRSIQTAGGITLELAPLDSAHVAVSPWPWTVDEIVLTVVGRCVPACNYSSRQELAVCPSEQVQLRWTLTPAESPE